ncbi:MAG: hypothetical protein ACP5JJ_18835 [Anaerolineae bacterium]
MVRLMRRVMERGLRLGLWGLMLTREKAAQFADERRQELDSVTPTSRRDIEELHHKVDALAAQVEELAG